MIAFYSFISIVFAVFSYILAIENKNNVKRAIFVAVIMLFLWPIVITAVTIYLAIYRCRKQKYDNLVKDADDIVWDDLKAEESEEVESENNNS